MPFSLSHFLITTNDQILLPSLHYNNSARDTPNKSLLIYVHGAGSSSIIRRPLLTNSLADSLSEIGTDLLTFNNRGAGYISKFDTTTGGQYMGGMAYESIADCIYDIDAAISWALDSGYTKIHLAGHSTGANKLVIWASNHAETLSPAIGSVILIAGGDDISLQRSRYASKRLDTLLNYYTQDSSLKSSIDLVPATIFAGEHPISWRSLYELVTLDSTYDVFPFARPDEPHAFEQFNQLPTGLDIAVVYGSDDFGTIIPTQAGLDILAKLLPISPYLVQGADHNFTYKEQELVNTITKHLERHHHE